ncbi:FG-GAP repeat domain-containing protein [Acidobacteriota bacterium]
MRAKIIYSGLIGLFIFTLSVKELHSENNTEQIRYLWKTYDVGKNADGLEIGDIDGDGKNELVVGNRGSRDLTIFKQDKNNKNSLVYFYTQKINWACGVIDITDINQDGFEDVVVAHYADYASTGKTDTFGVCYQNPETHRLDHEINYKFPFGHSSRAIGAGDVNSDGRAEIVVANEIFGKKIYVWGWNNRKSELELQETYGNINNYVVSISIGDVNGDKKNDVVLHGSSIFVFTQAKDGKLSPPKRYNGGGESADIGDVNNDGLNDVVGATAHSKRIEIWLQTPSHVLKNAERKRAGSYTEDVEVADLNNDGFADIAVACKQKSELLVFLQNESGQLERSQRFKASPNKWLNELAVGDLNGDNISDIAGSDWGYAGLGKIVDSKVNVWFSVRD